MERTRWLTALVRETFAAASQDMISQQAAALAYFALFALIPLLVVVLELAALVVGASYAQHEVLASIILALTRDAGASSAEVVDNALKATLQQAHHGGIIAGLFAWVIFLLAATGLLGAIQAALDHIWHVARAKQPWWASIKDRLVAFALIAGFAIVLLLSFVADAAIAALAARWTLPSTLSNASLYTSTTALTFVAIVGIFSAAFKILPHTHVAWRDAILGGTTAASFFTLGQIALGWYLARAGAASPFGAAGSLVVLVLWIYYSTQMFLLGAEFTKVFAKKTAPSDE